MTPLSSIRKIVDDITFNVLSTAMYVEVHKDYDTGGHYLQVHCHRPDTYTGEWGWGVGGRGYLDKDASEEAIVATAFGLLKAYVEHEAREGFTYQGLRVYGPHMSLAALMEASRASQPHPAEVPC